MEVLLVEYTPEPERVIAQAARLCYSEIGIREISAGLDQDSICKLVDKVIKLGHLSVLEHASFTFAIEGISRVASHQLVRHRIASYSQQSQRYVKYNQTPNYYIPETIANNRVFAGEYQDYITRSFDIYQKMINGGIPQEDARYLLPNAWSTNLIVTMNGRALYNFFSLRLCKRAQKELQLIAGAMLKRVVEVAPNLFHRTGIPCEITGKCDQGSLCCGHVKTLKARRP